MNFPLMPYASLLPDALGCQKHECVQKANRKICGRAVLEGLKWKYRQMTSGFGSPQATDCWQLGESNGEKITLAWLIPCMWGQGLGLLQLLRQLPSTSLPQKRQIRGKTGP